MEALLIPVLYLIGCYILYRVIRSAVRDGILDADEQRSQIGGDGRSIGS
ncbi:hypothetical protein [Glycomyces sp. NPDC021274]|jgi:hypothetical protein